MSTDYDSLGGEPAIRALITAFCTVVFDDFIIGFRFEGKDHARIIDKETEHACRHLGGPQTYTGRPVGSVHSP